MEHGRKLALKRLRVSQRPVEWWRGMIVKSQTPEYKIDLELLSLGFYLL